MSPARAFTTVWLLIPASWVAAFIAQAIAATLLLGRLPTYSNPDPKHIEPLWLLVLAGQWLFVAALASPVALGLYAAFRALRKEPLSLSRAALAAFFVGSALAALIVLADPLDLADWYFD